MVKVAIAMGAVHFFAVDTKALEGSPFQGLKAERRLGGVGGFQQ